MSGIFSEGVERILNLKHLVFRSSLGIKLWVLRFLEQLKQLVIPLFLYSISVGITYYIFSLFYKGYLPDETILSDFLSASAVIQGSLVSIIFAITILGIQLVSRRDSPLIISNFSKQPIFWFTFFIFVSTILVHLFLLFNYPFDLGIYTIGVYVAFSMSIGNVLILFIFIGRMISASTPSGSISISVQYITPKIWVTQIRLYSRETKHPMYKLYSIVVSSFENNDIGTVEEAIEEYGEKCSEMIYQFNSKDTFNKLSNNERKLMFNPVLAKQLPDISRRAHQKGEDKLMRKSVNYLFKLGESGLGIENCPVTKQSFIGLNDLLEQVPIKKGNFPLHRHVWNKRGELIYKTADGGYSSTLNTLLIMGTPTSRHFQSKFDARLHADVVRDYLRHLAKAHESLLNNYSYEINTSGLEWEENITGLHDHEDYENSEILESLIQCRKEFSSITSIALEKAEDPAVSQMVIGQMIKSWKKICLDAIEKGPSSYAKSVCQAMIEIAFFSRDLEFQYQSVSQSLAQIKHETGTDIIDEAFDSIKEYKQFSQSEFSFYAVDGSEGYSSLIKVGRFGPGENLPINQHNYFHDRIEEIEIETQKRYERLKAQENDT